MKARHAAGIRKSDTGAFVVVLAAAVGAVRIRKSDTVEGEGNKLHN